MSRENHNTNCADLKKSLAEVFSVGKLQLQAPPPALVHFSDLAVAPRWRSIDIQYMLINTERAINGGFRSKQQSMLHIIHIHRNRNRWAQAPPRHYTQYRQQQQSMVSPPPLYRTHRSTSRSMSCVDTTCTRNSNTPSETREISHGAKSAAALDTIGTPHLRLRLIHRSISCLR